MQPSQLHTEYYRARAAQERDAAGRASDPLVRRLHTEMADHYESFLIAGPAAVDRDDEAA